MPGSKSDTPTFEETGTTSSSDPVKQFKKSIFKPFWKNPNLTRQSAARDHFKHAFFTLTGKHSDILKKTYTANAFFGLMLQLLKLDDLYEYNQSKETFYSLFELLKLSALKSKQEVVESETSKSTDEKPRKFASFNSGEDKAPEAKEPKPKESNEKSECIKEKKYKYNLDKNSCPIKEIILKNGDINKLENHLGLIMNPIEAAALLCVEYSQHLRAKGRNQAQLAVLDHENKNPVLEFFTNLANRTTKNKQYFLSDVIEKYYKTVEAIFYFSVRLWVEIAALITAPLWQLAQTIIAGTVLTITFPIWYPIARTYYSKAEETSEASISNEENDNEIHETNSSLRL